MPDTQFTPIVLDPSTTSVSGPISGLPPMPAQPLTPSMPPLQVQPAPTPQQTVPLQPVPKAATTPMVSATPLMTPAQPATNPVAPTATPTQPTSTRQVELQQQLDTLSQEESKLLGTIKDWVSWIQGAETKKQTIERELAGLNTQFHLGDNASTATYAPAPTPTAPTTDRVVTEKQLREAEAKLKTIVDQQKIEEKKAFDNYSAGGINREGLLKEMERISTFYNSPLESAKAKIAELQTKLNPVATTPVPAPIPVQPVSIASTVTPQVMPLTSAATTPPQQKILDHLRTLSVAQTGYIKQLLVDLPNQGTGLTIERAGDGNGIIILAGTEQAYTLGHHFPDADLILAGLGADDITALPTGTLTGTQITPPAQASL